MRRLALLAALAAILLAGLAAGQAAASEAVAWHSQQPLGPEGRTPLGPVGDVECWAANRCLLITQGNSGMPMGLYAYDGSGWYLYSTVCGGHEGRIAWVGPDEFWTISDQQSGQSTKGSSESQRVSLCHFKDGTVIASYAEPLGVAGSYLKMNAAACRGPDECWFAGERLPGTVNEGAFHLYWNGLSLTATPSLIQPQPELEDPGRAVVSLAYHDGALFEGVRAQAGDEAPGEPAGEPSLLHRVLPGTLPAFLPAQTAAPIVYGAEGAEATQLQGFRLSDDGESLWAVSGAESAPAAIAVLRLRAGVFEQLPLTDPTPAFGLGDRVLGLAAEPGGAAAWVAYRSSADANNPPARLALIHADGTVDPPVSLPLEGEGIGRKGAAGPLACAAPGQCWMATQQGWLFHLGPDPAANADPAMHTLITTRPADASLPSVPPLELPEDNSGAGYEAPEAPLVETPEELAPRQLPPLVTKVHERVIGSRTLELSFFLRAEAHVRLIAKLRGHVVGRTPRYTLKKGNHRIRLRLDPDRWPTKLDLQVHQIKRGGRR